MRDRSASVELPALVAHEVAGPLAPHAVPEPTRNTLLAPDRFPASAFAERSLQRSLRFRRDRDNDSGRRLAAPSRAIPHAADSREARLAAHTEGGEIQCDHSLIAPGLPLVS